MQYKQRTLKTHLPWGAKRDVHFGSNAKRLTHSTGVHNRAPRVMASK